MDKIIIFTVLLLITITGYQYLGKVSLIVFILSLIYLLFQKQIDNLLYKKIEGLESNTETNTISLPTIENGDLSQPPSSATPVPASFEGSGILPVSQFISPAPSTEEQSESDDKPVIQPSIVQGLDAKSIAGNPVYYEPGTVTYKGLGYTPSYSEMTYLNNHVYKSEPEKINQVHKKGFCDQTDNIMNNINEKCNALPTDVCASTDCCVLFGGEKCVEGDENGPKNKMAYSDTSIKNRDAYYYQGDCYGNCQKGPRYVQPKQPENQIQPTIPAELTPVPSAMISPVPSAMISPAPMPPVPRPSELSPVPRSLPSPSASI